MTKWEKFTNGFKAFLKWILKVINILMIYLPTIAKYIGIGISLLFPKGKEAEAKRQVKVNEQKVAKLETKINKVNTKLVNTSSKLDVKKEKVALIQDKRKTK